MNPIIQNILTRRSVRKFKPDMIADNILDAIIEAGLYAPSTKNKQARHFAIIKGQPNIDKVTDITREATALCEPMRYPKVLNPAYTVNFGAPVFIIVTADPESGNPEADGAVALENMFLAAHSLGVGSVWINQLVPLANVPIFREFLTRCGVPEGYVVCGAAAFGYSAAEPVAAFPRREGQVTVIEEL
ncbi:MAG: nitroreductase [Deferribacteraceae bacterium]|jgi:nitroreductase|nr:nitroreductase [Deferribacteraceae bacterium]